MVGYLDCRRCIKCIVIAQLQINKAMCNAPSKICGVRIHYGRVQFHVPCESLVNVTMRPQINSCTEPKPCLLLELQVKCVHVRVSF